MSVAFQDKIIYIIVSLTILHLVFPAIKNLFRFLSGLNAPQDLNSKFSAYVDVCERCSVKK